MYTYSLTHLSDSVLLRNLAAAVAREGAATAEVLAHIAEVDARKLYVPAGFPSMYAYCVGELHLSDEAAFKRIHAARAARRFPAIFSALAEGRLHLSAVVMLAPHLTQGTADELLAGAVHKSKSEIEWLLAERFPRPDVPTRIQPLAPLPVPSVDQAPKTDSEKLEAASVLQHAPGRVEMPMPTPPPPSRVQPLAPDRFAIQFTMGKETHEMLEYAQALLSHAVPSGDMGQVLRRVLELAIPKLEKQKFAATSEPRPSRRSSENPRYIPTHVKRAVWKRDQGRCTFVGEKGQRCPSRKFLEFDHMEPVGRGGQATIDRIRLRCRPHNQFTAEQTFGAEFMQHKREQAKKIAAGAAAQEVIPWLRQLGFNADEARRAVESCESMANASLEERVRAALSFLAPLRGVHRGALAP